MKKFLKKHLFQLIYLIPVSFIAIGSFVLNIYLNQFGIIDVALFDSKTIFVGFIAVLQFILFFFFWGIYILKYTSSIRILFLVVNCFFKSIVFSVIISSFLCISSPSNNFAPHPLLGIFLVVGITTTYFMIESNSKDNPLKKGKVLEKIFFVIEVLVSIATIIISIFIIYKDEVLSEIFTVYNYLSIYFSVFLLVRWNRKKMVNEDTEEVSKFNANGKIGKLDYAYVLLYLLGMLMLFLMTYSKHAFPNISNNLGGGYYKYNTIVLDDDSVITGKIIHSNSEYIYLIEEEDKLSQYPINKVRAYEITKMNYAEEEIIEEEIEVIENKQLPEIMNDSEQ